MTVAPPAGPGPVSSGPDRSDRRPEGEALTFPDLPRLELDQLLGQLVEGAQEVMGVQGRLRRLLRATQTITSDLDLPVLLGHIVSEARGLVGARYAAVGVIAADGRLDEFVHVGMPADMMARVGAWPQGSGLLDALIDVDCAPIRLTHLGEDHCSGGVPAGHPVTDSVLGVPIRIRGEVYGILYLGEDQGEQFSAEDEQLVVALAATAGVAIDNARLLDAARSRQDWLHASTMISRRLLSVEHAEDITERASLLQMIAQYVRAVAGADLVTIVVPDGEGSPAWFRVEIAAGDGPGAVDLRGRRVRLDGDTLAGQVWATGTPLRVHGPDEVPHLSSVTVGGMDPGPMLVLPLHGPVGDRGVLTVARRRGQAAFTAEDLAIATVVIDQASLSLQLVEARAERRSAMGQERDRIATDLHDYVIQHLSGSGLLLQGVASGLESGPFYDRVVATISDLDATIDRIRTTLFGLHQAPPDTTFPPTPGDR